jgi:Spy/CpxP family protein refolding chaperone
MKKLITTVGLGILIALTSVNFAQDHPIKHKTLTKDERKNMSAEEKAKHKTDRMTKKLDLSEDQAKQIYALNLESEQEREVLKAEMKKLKEKSKAKRLEKMADIEKILTAEQNEKIKALKAKRQEKKKK